MKLADSERGQANKLGFYITERCDGCSKPINSSVQYTIKDDERVFCRAACRDKAFYSPSDLEKLIRLGTCVNCRGPRDGSESLYCTNCLPVADPEGLLTQSKSRVKRIGAQRKETVVEGSTKEEQQPAMHVNKRARTPRKSDRQSRVGVASTVRGSDRVPDVPLHPTGA